MYRSHFRTSANWIAFRCAPERKAWRRKPLSSPLVAEPPVSSLIALPRASAVQPAATENGKACKVTAATERVKTKGWKAFKCSSPSFKATGTS